MLRLGLKCDIYAGERNFYKLNNKIDMEKVLLSKKLWKNAAAFIVAEILDDGEVQFSVRGKFYEGGPVFPGPVEFLCKENVSETLKEEMNCICWNHPVSEELALAIEKLWKLVPLKSNWFPKDIAKISECPRVCLRSN